MDVLAPILVIALVALVVTFVAAPLRRGVSERARAAEEGRRADLEAAKVSKYREIRDAEMDLRTGKLSDGDWRELDRRLRAEAIEILHALDALGPADPDTPAADHPVDVVSVAQCVGDLLAVGRALARAQTGSSVEISTLRTAGPAACWTRSSSVCRGTFLRSLTE